MRTTKIFTLLLVLVLVFGCKRDGWLDWQIQNKLWLQENAQKEGVVTTPTGLQYKCIESGWDKSARPDDAKIVTIDYKGQLINGYVFDANEKYSGYVNSFVSGFAEGLKKMHEDGIYEFYIPYDLAYGANGSGTEGNDNFIPPYSTLIFWLYLHDVN